MRPTLIAIHHVQIGSRHFDFGSEIPPGLLPTEVVGQWIDQKWLAEMDPTDRRSLYRLLHRFSGCKEQEQLTPQEKQDLCL
jgi:hypothetical protein